MLTAILSCNCSSQNAGQVETIKSYYFPYAEFKEPRTYYYVNSNDTSEKSTWIMQTKVQQSDTLFSTQILDSKDRVLESLVEKITAHSSLLIYYKLFDYDSANNQLSRNCVIKDSLIFKWNHKLNESIVWRINYVDYIIPNDIEFSKTRKYVRYDKEKEQIVFKDQFRYAQLGTDKVYNWTTDSYYQKGTGLVNFKVHLPDGTLRDFKLVNIKKNGSSLNNTINGSIITNQRQIHSSL